MFAFNLFNEEDNNEDQYIEDVDLFLREHYNDRIVILTQTNYNHLRRPLLVFFHNFKLKTTKFWTDTINQVANTYPNIQFAVADLGDVTLFHQNPTDMDYLGLDGNYEPYGFAIDADERQYKYEEPVTIDALTVYCDKLANNKLYRSDPISNEQNRYGNRIIVAENFRQLVEQNEKNILLTIHSNYTFYSFMHCPERNSSTFDRETTAFYHINAYTNYVPLQYAVDKYPTTFAILRNDRSKILACGNYVSIEDALKKIQQNQQSHEEAECIGNTTTEDQKKLHGILEKLTEIVKKEIPSEENDDREFSKNLSAILNKVEHSERDSIKLELIILALNRVNLNK